MRDPKSIVITGATSGIGRALAEEYAAPGIRLCLTGRNQDRLAEVKASCEAKGAYVLADVLDVTDEEAVKDWLFARDDEAPIDLIVANAGISAGASGISGAEPAEQVKAVFRTNVDGVFNTILPLVQRMMERKRGHLSIMASVAGFRGFPGAPSYCGSKAAVKVFGEGLRGSLLNEGVEVSVICPGYVRSAMTDVNDFPMPFLMEADKAARIIRKGIEKKKARIVFPWQTGWIAWFLHILSPGLIDPILAKLPKK